MNKAEESLHRAFFARGRETEPPPVLDARLSAAAAYVRAGTVVADIGCDHGKLAVWLATAGGCKNVIASDIRPGPLARAQELCRRMGCANVECRLGDGLSVLRPGEAQDIVIAGVSGVTAAAVLAAAPHPFSLGTRFIFVPPTKHGVLRGFLAQHGFELLDETPVRAAGRLYTVMCAEYTGNIWWPTLYQCAVGKADKQTDAAADYLNHVADLVEKYARGAAERHMFLELAQQVRKAARRCR